MRINISGENKPDNIQELENIILKYLDAPIEYSFGLFDNFKQSKEITIKSDYLSIVAIVEGIEKILEDKGFKVRVITKGSAVAAVATGGIGLLAKAIHLAATYDPDYEIRKNYLTGTVDVIKMKV